MTYIVGCTLCQVYIKAQKTRIRNRSEYIFGQTQTWTCDVEQAMVVHNSLVRHVD